jgi:hypothetical protein
VLKLNPNVIALRYGTFKRRLGYDIFILTNGLVLVSGEWDPFRMTSVLFQLSFLSVSHHWMRKQEVGPLILDFPTSRISFLYNLPSL